MRKRVSLFLFFLAVFFAAAEGSFGAEEPKQVPAAIHIHSRWSSGAMDAEEIVRQARLRGVAVLIFTDSALRRWEYTLFPWLGPILRKTIEQPSVIKMGPSNYFEQLAALQQKYPDMLLLPATEVAPHYYWDGSPFKKNLHLHDWQKHLLVFGLEEPTLFKKMPLTSNPYARHWRWRTLLWLWPLPLLWAGWRLTKITKVSIAVARGQKLESRSRPFRWPGSFLLVLGAAALFWNFPFADSRSPHSGFLGASPYQEMIDYVRQAGGLVFWAHPEAIETNDANSTVKVETNPYPELLKQTQGYNGFGIFFEGYREVGGIGGVWDQTLLEYLQGARKEPVWALGELDFHGGVSTNKKSIDEVETMFWFPSRTRTLLLDALRTGKMYARWNHPRADLQLDRFEAISKDGKAASSGDTLATKSPITLFCSVSCSRGGPEKIKLQVIRNGKLWKTKVGTTPFSVRFRDNPREKTYYRIFVEGKYPMYLASNPIFVFPQGQEMKTK